MNIPKDLIDEKMQCNECGYISTPDIVSSHLVEQHLYTVAESQKSVDEWTDDFTQDEDGYFLKNCMWHGLYPIKEGCADCINDEMEIERWKDRKIA